MGTFILFAIILIVIILLFFAKDYYKDYKKMERNGGIRKKYKVLIDYFIEFDPEMIVLKETNMYCFLGAQHYKGSLTFRFQHTFDKININFTMNHNYLGVHKLEWVFHENMPQEDMIYHIEREIKQYCTEKFNN